MQKLYKVSVIIPAYNVMPYVEHCLNSVLNQTLSDLEIIVIDDGSTDGTEIFLDKYAIQYENRIRVIHQENKGVSAARNCGIYDMHLKKERALLKGKVRELKIMAKHYCYFGSVKCYLFSVSKTAYHVIRSFVVYLRGKKMLKKHISCDKN